MATLKENILACDKNVPRYTSYPTALHFKVIEQDSDAGHYLEQIPEHEELSLYIHLPFCPKLCWYCGCHTKITQQYEPVQNYLHLLNKEIDLLTQKLSPGHKISHIHFGGGSPGMMKAADFDALMSHLKQRFEMTPSAEIAIEIDPRNVTEARVSAYAKHGVSRISLGIQDFDEKVLASVNREQPFDLSYDALKLFRAYGIHHFNFDLMYGLPHQSVESMSKAIMGALMLGPDRIAFFGYAHVPWMKKHMRLINEDALPDNSLRYDLFEAGAKLLETNGFQPIGIDHFARADDEMITALKTGTLRRNFQGYTTDQAKTLIGIGLSSISKYEGGFTQNSPDMPAYEQAVTEGRLPVKKIYNMKADDYIRADIIERLMCDFKVDLSVISQKFGLDIAQFKPELSELRQYEDLGFVKVINNSVIQINKKARPAARLVCSVFDAYFQESQNIQRHARAV